MNINTYAPSAGVSPTHLAPGSSHPAKTQKSGDFASMLSAYAAQLNHDEKAASQAAIALAKGEGQNTSETLLAIQKADLSFQLMLSVRNKLVDAYHEVIRMQA
jgi:flagellar hook-basal body complex protein FliE